MDSRSSHLLEVSVGIENGEFKGNNKETRPGRTAHSMSSSSLRKKSDLQLISKVRSGVMRNILSNLQEVILGTKLSVLFPAIPLAITAQFYSFGKVYTFILFELGTFFCHDILDRVMMIMIYTFILIIFYKLSYETVSLIETYYI